MVHLLLFTNPQVTKNVANEINSMRKSRAHKVAEDCCKGVKELGPCGIHLRVLGSPQSSMMGEGGMEGLSWDGQKCVGIH